MRRQAVGTGKERKELRWTEQAWSSTSSPREATPILPALVVLEEVVSVDLCPVTAKVIMELVIAHAIEVETKVIVEGRWRHRTVIVNGEVVWVEGDRAVDWTFHLSVRVRVNVRKRLRGSVDRSVGGLGRCAGGDWGGGWCETVGVGDRCAKGGIDVHVFVFRSDVHRVLVPGGILLNRLLDKDLIVLTDVAGAEKAVKKSVIEVVVNHKVIAISKLLKAAGERSFWTTSSDANTSWRRCVGPLGRRSLRR
jgi:hypothetical protein